jgi:hypothetical protein
MQPLDGRQACEGQGIERIASDRETYSLESHTTSPFARLFVNRTSGDFVFVAQASACDGETATRLCSSL